MPTCCMKNCKNYTQKAVKKDGVSYFRFPLNDIERDKWRIIVSADRGEEFFKPTYSSVVCSDHFLQSDMYITKAGYRKIKKRVLPFINGDQTTPSKNDELSATRVASLLASKPYTISSESNTEEFIIEDMPASASKEPEDIVNANLTNRQTPSPTSSGLDSVCDSPKTTFYKKSLRKFQDRIEFKNKQINTLKKKNQRLIKRNLTLKQIVADLKAKRSD